MPRQVCSGAMLRCSLGSNPSFLTVQPHNRVIATNLAANIQDNKPGVNFQPFGVCVNIGGSCVPVTPLPWKPGGKPVKIGSVGILTLTETCTLICQVGGVIKVTDPGQSCVYIDQITKSVEIQIVNANSVAKNKNADIKDAMVQEVLNNDEMAKEVLNLFYPDSSLPESLNPQLRELAAVMLRKAIKGSNIMDYVPRPPGFRPGLTWLAKELVLFLRRKGGRKGIYENVRQTLAAAHRSEFELAKAGIGI
ncbi:DUF4280 domain-containing protein [Coleofasciculus sp. F4-SAH-05]|uniref:DUF4280 domain-containing protein n=1 Tax=Coleofasciculus sp. F4-SAH-05 TaxID=3069525 RepID=UPI00330143BB